MPATKQTERQPPAVSAPRSVGGGAQQSREALLSAALRSIPRPSRLEAKLTTINGAGPKLAAAAGEMGIETLGDLLLHIPRAYHDRTRVRLLGELRIGEEASVSVEVRSVKVRPTRRRNLRIVEASVFDQSGPSKAVWFNQAWLAEQLGPGTRLHLYGKLDRGGFRVVEHEILGRGDAIHSAGIVPVHPASERLRARLIREWISVALEHAPDAIEPLPASLRASRRYPCVADALNAAHFPPTIVDAERARERLAFEELFLHQAALAARRSDRDEALPAISLSLSGELTDPWVESLPFVPTGDQRRAMADIDADLGSGRPMHRLLMGEVGSGKTAVALFAMLRAVEAGYQAALMAPTETLAEQHLLTLERLAPPIPFSLLTGSAPAKRRREILADLQTGALPLIVGTHALIEEDVRFARLAVAVVDEQHRFGVRQRAALDAKGPTVDGVATAPHALHMTATPIPRTLSLTAYGDLDTTALHELPAGRRPVKTWAVGEEKRAGAYQFIRDQLDAGRQAFVVCPLVSESVKLQAKAATAEGERLARGEFADYSVAVIHGQLPTAKKAEAMASFAAGDADVLVATSVIEVGIDVPNASVMLIEEADRYGLSQLHQLRGRVGRGGHASHCILFANEPSELAQLRLRAISTENDGFKLAETDLTLRGEGEILGTRQHGLPRFKVAELPADAPLLSAARKEVLALVRRYGSLQAPELGPLMDAVRERFGDERDLQIAA